MIKSHLLAVCALALAPIAGAQSPLTQTAVSDELSLSWLYFGRDFASRCGSDWLVIEASHWKCVRRLATGQLSVISLGPMPSELAELRVIRETVPGDSRLLFAQPGGPYPGGNIMRALDPVTFQVSNLDPLPEWGWPGFNPKLLTVDATGRKGLLLRGWGAVSDRIVALPDGSNSTSTVLQTLPFLTDFVAQIDADPQSELGVLDVNGTLRFYDSITLQQEPYQPAGVYFEDSNAPTLVFDWDNDGIDEIAKKNRQGSVSLIDPNSPAIPLLVSTGQPGFGEPVARIDWQATNSRDLVLWDNLGVYVTNPRTGAVLAQFPFALGPQGRPEWPIASDWDNDGDQDLAWVQSSGSRSLMLLRNGNGVVEQQKSAEQKLVVGHAGSGAEQRLVSIEPLVSLSGVERHLRLRNPQTLELLSDSTIDGDSFSSSTYSLADLHPQVGTELLQAGEHWLRLYSLDGSLLWSKENSDPIGRRFRGVRVPDQTCSGTNCQRILLFDVSISNNQMDRMRMLDSAANGAEIWNAAPSGGWFFRAPVGLTDLDGDGNPEILYSEFGPPQSEKLLALDGETRNLRWESSDLDSSLRVRRTNDNAKRLAILNGNSMVAYLNPADGSLRRSISPNPGGSGSCFSPLCDLQYLPQGETAGLWILANGGYAQLHVSGRSFREPAWNGGGEYFPSGIAVSSPQLVNMASGTTLYTFAAARDTLFAEEFEGW